MQSTWLEGMEAVDFAGICAFVLFGFAYGTSRLDVVKSIGNYFDGTKSRGKALVEKVA